MPVFKTGAFNRSAIPPGRDCDEPRMIGDAADRFNSHKYATDYCTATNR